MPIYDLACNDHVCGNKMEFYTKGFNAEFPHCPECGSDMHTVPSLFKPDVFPSEGVFLEHASAKGETFHSKKEMRDFEKQTGAYIDMAH